MFAYSGWPGGEGIGAFKGFHIFSTNTLLHVWRGSEINTFTWFKRLINSQSSVQWKDILVLHTKKNQVHGSEKIDFLLLLASSLSFFLKMKIKEMWLPWLLLQADVAKSSGQRSKEVADLTLLLVLVARLGVQTVSLWICVNRTTFLAVWCSSQWGSSLCRASPGWTNCHMWPQSSYT